jgi:hypothetical protein
VLERVDQRQLIEQVGLNELQPVAQVLDARKILRARPRTIPNTS